MGELQWPLMSPSVGKPLFKIQMVGCVQLMVKSNAQAASVSGGTAIQPCFDRIKTVHANIDRSLQVRVLVKRM